MQKRTLKRALGWTILTSPINTFCIWLIINGKGEIVLAAIITLVIPASVIGLLFFGCYLTQA